MGIAAGALELLSITKREVEFSGNVLQLGKQDIYFTKDLLNCILSKYGFPEFLGGGALH